LKQRDFLLLHIEAPDEAGHMGRADLKTEALERIDELILGPLLRDLPALDDFRLLLMPDHATPSKLKTHSNEAVPFAMLEGKALGGRSLTPRRYTEAEAQRTGVVVAEGHRLIGTLFGAPLATEHL
jgi:2,3-bisphosphoglycerate-independent phosphoglycerate mutase